MILWAIVPVKPLRRGKSRLAEVLSGEERAALNKKLLIHTLDTITNVPAIEQVLVVSRDPEALAIARFHGARTLLEDGAPHLNLAITRATAISKMYNAVGVLVLPADLPQMTPEDVNVMVEASGMSPSVVIAPDHRRTGTNALLIKPPGLLTYEFGVNSFTKHVEQTRSHGVEAKIVELPSLAHDVDLPEDLVFLNGDLAEWTQTEEKPSKSNGYYSEMLSQGSSPKPLGSEG
ncbi:MAG TPA: 2-phospho-L-lactate guanylyltransferase [Anaerolineales bacterium]|nr:2-phospho-L-lactate guanylyltransferase [Anaerolineales bacterium]